MTLKVFLELVEIKAKTASILPCLLGFCFAWYHYQRFEWLPALVFFVAMVLFNMAVDMLDNYHDFVHAVDTEDYQQNTNIIGRESLSAQQILWDSQFYGWGFSALRLAFYTPQGLFLCLDCQLGNSFLASQWV